VTLTDVLMEVYGSPCVLRYSNSISGPCFA